MLISNDCDLSLSLRYEEPVKEAFKETMLRQDYTFKNQVHELHRLYYAQTTMMKDMRWKEFDGTYFSREGRQDNPVTFGHCITPLSIRNPKALNRLQEQRAIFPGFQQWLSSPQIRSTHHPEKNQHYRPSERQVNLSLGIGRNGLKASGRTKTSNHIIIDLEDSDETEAHAKTKTWSNIIDLEESNQTVSKVELKPQSSTANGSYSGYKRDCESTHSFANIIKDSWFDRTPINGTQSMKQHPTILHSYSEATNIKGKAVISEDISAKRTIILSDDGSFLDLNKSICDDSFQSDDPSLACSSRESHVLDSEPRTERNDNSSKDSSAFVQRIILNSTTGSSCSYKGMENIDVDQFPIDLNQPISSNSGNPYSLIKSFGGKKEELAVEILDTDDHIPSTPEIKGTKAKQDVVSSPECKTQGSYKSPSSCKSSCFEDLSSGLETSQCSEKKRKTSEVDGVIKRGAVSLLYLALECSEPSRTEKVERPQCSTDTFEEMVLKQPESSIDQCCVTSNAFEFDDLEKKEHGITLKRGRRMKDFQRDIMPNLATLSRHEICEDVKIMETALRSREYKKLRSKMKSENKWFNPVRSRRSRLNYVGRKNYY